MPKPSNYQTAGMAEVGRSPAIDGSGFIADIAYKVKVRAITSAYTVSAADSGTVFTTRGASAAVTFTLPAVASGSGCVFTFISAANFAMTVASAEGDNIVTFNDAAADSIALSTANEIIGGAIKIIGDGTVWYALMNLSEAQTPTIAT